MLTGTVSLCPRLTKGMWQVHDEVIVEGPKETADIALQLIEDCMQRPFNGRNPFEDKVQLLVDAKYADTWYEAK